MFNFVYFLRFQYILTSIFLKNKFVHSHMGNVTLYSMLDYFVYIFIYILNINLWMSFILAIILYSNGVLQAESIVLNVVNIMMLWRHLKKQKTSSTTLFHYVNIRLLVRLRPWCGGINMQIWRFDCYVRHTYFRRRHFIVPSVDNSRSSTIVQTPYHPLFPFACHVQMWYKLV